MLQAQGLRFGYNGRAVLDGIDLTVAGGEILAILGPNGAGKTTLLRCLNGLLRPQGGVVLLDGRDMAEQSAAQVARTLGYVAQRSEAGRLTAFDAVLLGRKPHLGWRVSQRDMDIAAAALRQVDMEHLALRPLERMSGGELQKVCIARALAQQPRVLLLDEPTSSLDLRNQQEVLRTIRQVVRASGMAAVLTLHDLNTALRFAQRLLFVRRGQVHSLCQACELTPETVEAVYGLAVEIVRHGGHTLVVPLEPEPKE